MGHKKAVSIVVPTLNEADNIQLLVTRIAKTFQDSEVSYEIIFVDDHSKDETQQNIARLAKKYPITLHKKVGSRGKAHSLLQGFDHAKHDIICMIDADLQYPPEAILPMYELIAGHGADVVITHREENETSALRKLTSKVFSFVFTRLLFGFNYDSQSGLKVFKKQVIERVHLNPTPWSFDLEFIVRSLENDFKILSHRIIFSERNSGVAKVKVVQVTYELAKASLALRARSSRKKTKHAYQRNLKFAKQIKGYGIAMIFLVNIVAASLLSYGDKHQGINFYNNSATIQSVKNVQHISNSSKINKGQQ